MKKMGRTASVAHGHASTLPGPYTLKLCGTSRLIIIKMAQQQQNKGQIVSASTPSQPENSGGKSLNTYFSINNR